MERRVWSSEGPHIYTHPRGRSAANAGTFPTQNNWFGTVRVPWIIRNVAVVVPNKKPFDTSYAWLIVSRVTAAVLGGFVVTYWTGAAVAKMAMEWDLMSRGNAGMFSGFVQLPVYVALIIWVCATASMRKTWLVLAVLTVLLVGVTEFTPGPLPTP